MCCTSRLAINNLFLFEENINACYTKNSLERNKANETFVVKKKNCIIIISNVNLIVSFLEMLSKKKSKKGGYLVWTNSEVQLLYETTRNF